MSRELVFIAHNLRSCYNVGSLLRTADGMGVTKILLTGYTPYPLQNQTDSRLPHEAAKVHHQISKVALGAEISQPWQYILPIKTALKTLKDQGYVIAALEQAPGSIALSQFDPPGKLAVILGRETEGVEAEIIKVCDVILEIPMKGRKESLNVVQAAAIAMYQLGHDI